MAEDLAVELAGDIVDLANTPAAPAPLLDVEFGTDGNHYSGEELTPADLAARLAGLARNGHHISIQVHINDPDRMNVD